MREEKLRLVKQHYVEQWLQVAQGLAKGGCGGKLAIDQNDGRLGLRVGVEPGVHLQVTVHANNGFLSVHGYLGVSRSTHADGAQVGIDTS